MPLKILVMCLPRREGVAVEEGEIGGDEVWPVGHPDSQLGGEVVLGRRNQRKQIVPGSRAAHAVGSSEKKRKNICH